MNEIHPPDPIEEGDGSVYYPTDPDFVPEAIPEQDLTPVEGEFDEGATDFGEG